MNANQNKNLKTHHWRIVVGIAALYLLTRCYGLTALPIFTDEAIYIHWAQIITDDINELFISKVDAKQPLFMWLNALTLQWFADPLVAGRAVSILAGFFSLTGIYLIGQRLYNPLVGQVAALCYVFFPYTLFFDRLALVDSLLSALGVWIFFVSWNIGQPTNRQTFYYILLGLLLGLSFLTKATALLLFPVAGVVLLLQLCHKHNRFAWRLCLSIVVACAVVLPFFLAGEEIMVSERTMILHRSDLILNLDEMLSFPWLIWLRNILVIWEFYYTYLTWPVVVVLVFGFFLALAKPQKNGLALVFWATFPSLAIVLVANGFFSRYFVIAQPPLTLLAALALVRLSRFLLATTTGRNFIFQWSETKRFHTVLATLLLLTLSDSFFFTWRLAHDPLSTPVHEFDRAHYLEGMNSGYGIVEAVTFLEQEAKRTEDVVLMVSTNLGNPQEGLAVYLHHRENMLLVPTPWWPQRPRLIPPDKMFPLFANQYKQRPEKLELTVRLHSTYFVYPFTKYPQEKFMAENPDFKKVWSYSKPDPQYSLDIFKRENGKK